MKGVNAMKKTKNKQERQAVESKGSSVKARSSTIPEHQIANAPNASAPESITHGAGLRLFGGYPMTSKQDKALKAQLKEAKP